MGFLQLHKYFYKVSVTNENTVSLYTLVDPITYSANTYVADTNTLIETNVPITKLDTGKYYVSLDNKFYASDVTYETRWFITYNWSPDIIRILNKRFRININPVSNQIEIQVQGKYS